MRMFRMLRTAGAGLVLTAALVAANPPAAGQARPASPELKAMLPQIAGWRPAEAAQAYFPESLFERIDGAAESYLAYDFKELLAAEFALQGGEATMTLEIYDMGTPLNAFGIFSAERFPENRPVDIGLMGYLDGETLNFVVGRYYVKLLGYGLGPQTAAVLVDFARRTSAPVKDPGVPPALFARFPRENMVPMSEKFINRNFLGFEFLGQGYQVSYRLGDQEFEGFVAALETEARANTGLKRLLEFYARERAPIEPLERGWRIKTRYGQLLMVDAAGTHLAGVIRVPDGLEKEAARVFQAILKALGRSGT